MKRRKHVGCGLLAAGILLPIAYCAGVLNCVIEPFWFRNVTVYEDYGKLHILYSTEFDEITSGLWFEAKETARFSPKRLIDNPVPITLHELRAKWGLRDGLQKFRSDFGVVHIQPMAHGYRVSGIYEDPRNVKIRFSTFVPDEP